MKISSTLRLSLCFLFGIVSSLSAAEWLHLPAKPGSENGKQIVFVTGDDEYKSETSMPMMAHILAEHHGFDCRVLFAINRKSGVIDTNQRDNIPGLEALADADLMVIYTRFRTLEDRQMQMIENYLATGKPVIGIRTSTHAFDFSKAQDSPFKQYSYDNKDDDYRGGFGEQVLGQTWISHWGHHGKQSSRGVFAPGMAGHPILRGIKNGEIWGPTDTYTATLPQPEGCNAILMGEICENMEPDSGPAPAPPPGAKGRAAIDKNNPMMPIAWTYQRPVGVQGRVFASTIGGAMSGKDDWANTGMRRMFVNACFWTLKMEDQIPERANVKPVLTPNPFRRGVKPEETLQAALVKERIGKDTILFYGNSMVERLLEHGAFEARLQIAQPEAKLKIRSLAWTGDEVGNRLRLEGYPQHMKNLLEKWPAKTIVLGYGFYESFAGGTGLADFEEQYQQHLRQIALSHPGARLVLLSPIAMEGASAERNAEIQQYRGAIAKLAEQHDAEFVDLFTPTKAAYADADSPLTVQGIHLNDAGNQVIAKTIAGALGASVEPDPAHLHEVALAAGAKQDRVAAVVRPLNAVVYFGVRKRPQEYADEMPRYHEMIRLTEAVVHQLANDPSATFASVTPPSLEPMGEGKGRDDGNRTGIIKPIAEQMTEFKVADGYAFNLFASEEEFPELRNPVQIALDARGRLWVVTMPSFPHTVPGLTPPDKILILEDTDRDGRADKVTTYMDQLDALDGVAFHRDGVIISEQPRLWMTRDTDGDDVMDEKTELLRGIDVTDSHHGGMIATDPLGQVIFSDGVFHRSQLETPFGVHRGIDATTYRLNPNTGRINTEWQHTTPNPWDVSWDRWGNIFQMYGDGGTHDGAALMWTPLGGYHPYNYAEVGKYGKGSGLTITSSSNFPDEFQQGVASASLLGRYAVNLTTFEYDQGLITKDGPLTLLSSYNAAFRPADLEFGMDGALYVSDFCSPIIGHAQHPMRDPHWDHNFGRIWRIVHTKKPVVTDWPQIEGASASALCELLVHPQRLVRKHARIELRKQGPDGIRTLDNWIEGLDSASDTYEQAILEATFVCAGLGDVRPAWLQTLSDSSDPMYRGAAVDLMRLLADDLENLKQTLTTLAADPHARVQMKVIGAVAHLRQTDPSMNDVLAAITSDKKAIKVSLERLEMGTKPLKGRSVPVLDVDPRSELTHWMRYDPKGEDDAMVHTSQRSSGGNQHLYRTFVESTTAQSAIVGINCKALDIKVNEVLTFSQNSLWSGDQQVQVDLVPGRNVIEIELKKPRMGRAPKGLPAVYLYNSVGARLSRATTVSNSESLQQQVTAYDAMLKERGQVLRVQAALGLQFSPTALEVPAGSKVRLIFENPDVIVHNFLLLAPGSFEKIGAMADALAASPEGMAKQYVPASDHVLVASTLVPPKGKEELIFTAPKEPGAYPYVCTFPGHWRLMKGVLTVTPAVVKKPSKPQPVAPSVTSQKGNVMFETANAPRAFSRLPLPSKAVGKVEASKQTSNDPIGTLTDGKLAQGFGPIFGNGIKDGAYMMDLGSVKKVAAATSWSFHQAGKRGAQDIEIFGSKHATHPGWNLADGSRFTALGGVSSEGKKLQAFTALSLRSPKGKSLGNYRWIVWRLKPITSLNENTAIQELGVELVE